MIRFIYALGHEEPIDTEILSAAGFSGVEQHRVGFLSENFVPVYRVVPAQQPGTSPVTAGHALREQAEAHGDVQILLENGGAFASPRELWQVLEAANHPRVKIGWSAATARVTQRTAAMAVPTLNLRLGLVRLDDGGGEAALAYARRLAGIGFSGWIVIDPPAMTGSEARREAARDIAAAILAELHPRKLGKTTAKCKA